MPNKCLATSLALGFLAFMLSAVPTASAQETGVRQLPRGAQCTWRGGTDTLGLTCLSANCHSDESQVDAVNSGGKCQRSYCCKKKSLHTTTGSVNPCDDMVGPGYEYVQPSGQPGQCVKKTKSMKKIKCSNPNAKYNGQTKRCELPMKQMGKEHTGPKDKTALRNACVSNNWVWDEKRQRCKKPSQAKADCEARGPRFRYDIDTRRCIKRVDMSGEGRSSEEFDDEDFQPKKKKKKPRLDIDIF